MEIKGKNNIQTNFLLFHIKNLQAAELACHPGEKRDYLQNGNQHFTKALSETR